MVWSTDPDVSGYNIRPHADLDLLVHRVSDNQQVTASRSFDNTYEIVDFTAPVTGEYSLRHGVTCPAGAVIPYGWALFS